MFFKKKGLPEKNEFVLCKVKRILPHCAFVILEEYERVEAMLHISEISSRFIKNIKEHLSVGNKLVCKVLDIDRRKGHVDVSLKRVSNVEKKNKMNEIKTQVKIEKLIEIISKKQGHKNPKQVLKKIGDSINEIFGSIPDFYYVAKEEGVEVIDEIEGDEKIKEELKERLLKHFKSQRVNMRRILKVYSEAPDGLLRLKKLFKGISELADKEDIEIIIRYISTPDYEIEITTKNYKQGEGFFKKAWNYIEDYSDKNQIKVEAFEEE